MKVFITYPDRRGYDEALKTLGDAWTGRWGAQAIDTAKTLIQVFAPKKVIL